MARGEYQFFYPFRVRYSEIDAQKIVFNSHYLTYFDTAITEFLRAHREDLADIEGEFEFHTVKNLVEYKAPIYFDEEIDVGVRISRIGSSSLTFSIEIHSKGLDDLRTSGEVVWVYTDQASRKTVPVPEIYHQIMAES
jgi:acyl-CoA thioester hydrolase